MFAVTTESAMGAAILKLQREDSISWRNVLRDARN